MKPFVIPFFLPQQGCPHRCLYCNQHRSGGRRPEPLSPASVTLGLEAGLNSPRRQPRPQAEAAFFGGTFTALPRERQAALLGACTPFLASGRIQGVRLSTRPDALPDEEIAFLRRMGVTTVEIGAQSMDDRVLEAAGRGHTGSRTIEASLAVKKAGLRLGLQLMPGLPGEDDHSRTRTLETVLDLQPDEARLYPLVVLQDTPLAEQYRSGRYAPLPLDDAVDICARLAVSLIRAGVIVSRIGLQDGPELSASILAGPHHPAFGHLVRSRIFHRSLEMALLARPVVGTVLDIRVHPRELPQAVGDRRRNLTALQALLKRPDIRVRPDPRVLPGQFVWQNQTFSVIPEESKKQVKHI